jgi:hypothetical protein
VEPEHQFRTTNTAPAAAERRSLPPPRTPPHPPPRSAASDITAWPIRRTLTLGTRRNSTSPFVDLAPPPPPPRHAVPRFPPPLSPVDLAPLTMDQALGLSFGSKRPRPSVPSPDELAAALGRVSLGALQDCSMRMCWACKNFNPSVPVAR